MYKSHQKIIVELSLRDSFNIQLVTIVGTKPFNTLINMCISMKCIVMVHIPWPCSLLIITELYHIFKSENHVLHSNTTFTLVYNVHVIEIHYKYYQIHDM